MAPGTSSRTNPNAMATITRNTIFTNVGQRSDGGVFWEGLDEPMEPGVTFTSWLGKPWKPGNGWLGFGGGVGGPRVGSTWGQNGGLGVPVLLVGVKMVSVGSIGHLWGPRWYLWGQNGIFGGQDGVCGVLMVLVGAKMASFGVNRASLGAKMASVGSQDGVCGVNMASLGAKMASVGS